MDGLACTLRSSCGHGALCLFVVTEKKFTLIINQVSCDKVITQLPEASTGDPTHGKGHVEENC